MKAILKNLRTTLMSIMIGMQNARQKAVNRQVAEEILRHAKSDYPYHTVESLTHELNEKMGIK